MGLDIDLGELGLPVGPQVLVPEAPDDLKVALDPPDHQDLLEQLGGLRERVEAPSGEPARDQEVPGTLGSGSGQGRGLDLDEPLAVEVVADRAADLVAEPQVPQHGRAAEVQVPVPETERLDGLLALVEREGKGLGLVEDPEPPDAHLDLPGRELGVDGPRRPPADRPLHRQDELGPDLTGQGVGRGVEGRVEDELGQALPIPEVHEDEASVVAPAERPAHQGDAPPGVGRAERAAGVGAGPAVEPVRHPSLAPARRGRSANHST